MKNLEFNIIENKYLEVADFTWLIKRIDAIYISRSNMNRKNEYAIFVQSSDEIVELYYRTEDELKISKHFNILSKAIMETEHGFNYAGGAALINYNNVKSIEFDKGVLSTKIIT